MYYVWNIASSYPNSCWLQYDWKRNPDSMQFSENNKLCMNSDIIFYLQKKANRNTFLKYDYIMSDVVSLVSRKLRDVIIETAINDIQLIGVKVLQGDDFLDNYYIPIYLNVVDCIDRKKSIFDKEIEDFTKIVFKTNSLKEHIIVKAKGDEFGNPIVQYLFVDACNKNKIKGIEFYKEPYINPLYEKPH